MRWICYTVYFATQYREFSEIKEFRDFFLKFPNLPNLLITSPPRCANNTRRNVYILF